MVPISANPNGESPIGMSNLISADIQRRISLFDSYNISALSSIVPEPKRSGDGPLLFEFDHCFPIKGQGTVLTGTILKGSISGLYLFRRSF